MLLSRQEIVALIRCAIDSDRESEVPSMLFHRQYTLAVKLAAGRDRTCGQYVELPVRAGTLRISAQRGPLQFGLKSKMGHVSRCLPTEDALELLAKEL